LAEENQVLLNDFFVLDSVTF